MRYARRQFLKVIGGMTALWTPSSMAAALDYPKRPVRIVVGFAAGGAPDLLARMLAQWLSEKLGQAFVVENHPGASSNLAAEAVVRAPADGYMLYVATIANSVNATLHSGTDFSGQLEPVASIAIAPYVLVVQPTSPTQTVREFIAKAKSDPGKLTVGSSAAGTPPYLSGTLFRMMSHIDVLQVPHRNSLAAVTELMAGRLAMVVSDLSAVEFVRTGKLRAIAVTSTERQRILPDVPALNEFLPGYEAVSWYGISVAKGTSAEIVSLLNRAINAVVAAPENRGRLNDLGFTVRVHSPAEFAKFVAAESEKWGKVIRAANIKVE